MYDQWSCGNDTYIEDWINFVEMVSQELNIPGDEVMRYLQTCTWFKKGYTNEW